MKNQKNQKNQMQQPKQQPKTILLIDGDIVAYRNAAVAEQRYVEVVHLPTGKKKEFQNGTAFKDHLKSIGKEYDENTYLIIQCQRPLDVEVAKKHIQALISTLHDSVWPDVVEVYIGEGDTFRSFLDLPTRYKCHREASAKPLFLKECRKYLIDEYNAEVIKDIETDDYLSIRAYEELAKGNRAVIASIDKDSYQADGVEILNWNKPELEPQLIGSIGELTIKKAEGNSASNIKGSGLKFLAWQMLAGDPTDGFKPYELQSSRFGPTAAYKLLKDLSTEKEILQAVVQQYKDWYSEGASYETWNKKQVTKTWQEMLDMYFKCAYMKRSKDDKSSAEEFFAKQGVNLE